MDVLLCRAGGRLCALPLLHVVETMRALPLEPLEGAPECVSGLSMVRGQPCPVLDLPRLLGDPAPTGFWILLRLAGSSGERRVALAVSGIERLRRFAPEELQAMPQLLSEANAGAVQAISRQDSELVLVLQAAALVSEAAWAALEGPP